MARKTLTLGLVIIALHLFQEVFLGVNVVGSLIANVLQISSAVLAAVMCVSASRRGVGFVRLFWLLIACSFLAWGFADLGWIYYESFFHTEPPLGSIFPFLVNTRSLFLAMALLLDQKDESSHLDLASFLDFVQLVIIFSLIYLGWYYVPSLTGNIQIAILRSAEVEIGEDLAVLGLALMQAGRARTSLIRSLYLAIALYMGLLTAGTILTDYMQTQREVQTGTWLDLWWTVPYLLVAFWASRWQPGPGFYPALRRAKSFGSTLLDNTMFAAAPLIVLLQASQLGPSWRTLSFSLLGVSIVCFAARLALSEFREARSALSAHKADQDRLEAESKFRIAFHANPKSITITSLENGAFLEVNDAFVHAMGYERSELIGKNALELGLWVDDRERIPILDKLRRGDRISENELRFRTKSGDERQMLLSAHSVQMHGQPCVLSILQDVTEQNLLEQQLRQAQKMEALGQLAGGVAHDFNNLLSVIIGYGDLLETELPSNSPLKKRVDAIMKAGRSAASLTGQLLAFSRRQVLQPKVLNLNTVVMDTQKMLLRVLGEDIQPMINLEGNLGSVKADPGQMLQVIMNLAINARDAMPKGGKLTVETANAKLEEGFVCQGTAVRPGPYVMLAVRDTGLGMDNETMARMFEPFFTTKSEGKGTGLGLATVYGIVKQSGGYIFVESELGNGTTFKIFLPRVDEAVEPTISTHSTAVPLRGSRTILLVEDETELRNLIQESLRADGYRVLVATNGVEAIQIVESHQDTIDLLVTDVIMPQMSGPELAQWLMARRPAIKVLYMSGYTDDRLQAIPFSDPQVALIQKPFPLGGLGRKVRELLVV